MEEHIGYAASDQKASKVLSVLDSKGSMDGAVIAKTARIISAEKTLHELTERGLIMDQGGMYALTDTGKQVIRKLRGVR